MIPDSMIVQTTSFERHLRPNMLQPDKPADTPDRTLFPVTDSVHYQSLNAQTQHSPQMGKRMGAIVATIAIGAAVVIPAAFCFSPGGPLGSSCYKATPTPNYSKTSTAVASTSTAVASGTKSYTLTSESNSGIGSTVCVSGWGGSSSGG